MKTIKNLTAIVLCIIMMFSMMTAVSATETTEYITIDLVGNGANAVLFGTQTEVDAVIAESDNTAYDTATASRKSYISLKTPTTNNKVRVLYVLNKTNFDAIINSETKLTYDLSGNIPFKISTELNQNNGVNVGGSCTGETKVTVNAEKPWSKAYAYSIMNENHSNSTGNLLKVKIYYKDGSSEYYYPKVKKPVSPATADYLWGTALSFAYKINYVADETTSPVTLKASSVNTNVLHPNIMTIETDVNKIVDYISFQNPNSDWAGAIVGLTGQVASAEEIAAADTVAAIAQLKAGYASAAAITAENCNDAKALLDKISDAYIPAEDADYVAEIKAAVEAKISEAEAFLAKYDYFDIEKNIPLASTIGSTVKLAEGANSDNRVFNIKALENKIVNGYVYAADGTPLKVGKDANGNYVRKVTTKASSDPSVTFEGKYTINVEQPKNYNEISIMAISSYDYGEAYNYDKSSLNFTVTYADDTTEVFGPKEVNLFNERYNGNESKLLASETASYVQFKANSADYDTTMPWIRWNANTNQYGIFVYMTDFYVPVYKLSVDPTQKVKSITVVSNKDAYHQFLMAVTAKKVTLAEVIDGIEVTDENYKSIKDMLNALPEGELTAQQEAKLEIIEKQIKFFDQEYVPFTISEDKFNSKVFVSESVPNAEVNANDYIYTGNGYYVLDKDAWDKAKVDGLIYSMNNIPFDVNTDKGILFGGSADKVITIPVTEGKYDSVSAALAMAFIGASEFEMKANYSDGTSSDITSSDVDPGWHVAYVSSSISGAVGTARRDADSFIELLGGKMQLPKGKDTWVPYAANFYFPVVTLDTDEEKTLVSVTFTNNNKDYNTALLGLTGSVSDSTNKRLERVFNSYTKKFHDKELEAAHEAYVSSYDTGLYTNETYGLEPMDAIYVKYENDTLSGKVMSYVNEDNKYTVVALVLNADDSYADVEIMGSGTANLSAHDFSETITLEEGQKIKLLLWEDFTTLKPYMTAMSVN